MRPKYSSPGAELLNSWHCKCCHLLLVDPQGSAFFEGVGDADGLGVGAACVDSAVFAIASTASGTNTMRFTCECSPWERPARSDVRALGIVGLPAARRVPSQCAKERACIARERARR